MKLFLFIFALMVAITANAQRKFDVLHYKYEIELNDNNDTIRGNARISFIVTDKNGIRNGEALTFDLKSTDKQSKGGMLVRQGMDQTRSQYSRINRAVHENNKVILMNGADLKQGDTSWVVINYYGVPSDGLIISKNQSGKRTFFADNWPNRAHHWIPCVDDPADKASVEFIVTAPSHYQVISNGVQIEETNLPGNKKLTHYKETVPLPTKVMVIGAADFAVNNIGDTNCIPVSSWVYAEDRDNGFYDYAIGKDILGFFIHYIGPYPYKKLANVQSKTRFGGMENAGAIFYNESTVTGRREEERLFAHEIVHQWFGNMATEKSFAHLWLSEGFATYLTHVYLESKYGTDTLKTRMKEERDEIIDFVKRTNRPVVDSTPNFMELLNANSYQKGSWVLHMLRRDLGDSVFHKAIRTYYAIYAGKNAETSDLRKIFELVSGKKLDQFFKQWLFTPENLQLDISWKYDNTKKTVVLTVKQLQSALFEFPLELLIQESPVSMPKRNIKKITQRSETIEFPASTKPARVEIDPMVSLLYEGKLKELK